MDSSGTLAVAVALDLIEYHDDGIYLGDPEDPEDREMAYQNLMRTAGPDIPVDED